MCEDARRVTEHEFMLIKKYIESLMYVEKILFLFHGLLFLKRKISGKKYTIFKRQSQIFRLYSFLIEETYQEKTREEYKHLYDKMKSELKRSIVR